MLKAYKFRLYPNKTQENQIPDNRIFYFHLLEFIKLNISFAWAIA